MNAQVTLLSCNKNSIHEMYYRKTSCIYVNVSDIIVPRHTYSLFTHDQPVSTRNLNNKFIVCIVVKIINFKPF